MLTPISIILLLLTCVSAADKSIVIGQNILQFGRDQYPSYWRDVEQWSKNTGVLNGSKPSNSDKYFGVADDIIVDESDCGGCNCDWWGAYCGCSGNVHSCHVVMENTGGNIESCDTTSCSERISYTQTQTVSEGFDVKTDVKVFEGMSFGASYSIRYEHKQEFSDDKTVSLSKGETCTWISLKAYVECSVFNVRNCMNQFVPPHDCTTAGGCQRTTTTRTIVNYDGVINCYKPTGGLGTISIPETTLDNALVVQY